MIFEKGPFGPEDFGTIRLTEKGLGQFRFALMNLSVEPDDPTIKVSTNIVKETTVEFTVHSSDGRMLGVIVIENKEGEDPNWEQ